MSGVEPPIQAKTISDSLRAAGVSWKIYTQLPSGYTYASAFAGFMDRFGWTGNVVTGPTFSQFIADTQSGNLPSVWRSRTLTKNPTGTGQQIFRVA